MTDNELKKAQQEYFKRAREQGIENYYKTKEYKEFSCIEMINSILAYGFNRDPLYVLAREFARPHNYLKEYVEILGEKKVLELIKNQINDIKSIETGVYTDYEGVSYNSIVWVR